MLDPRFEHKQLVYMLPGAYYTLNRNGSVLAGKPPDLNWSSKIVTLCYGKVKLEQERGR